jgi:hypothetical protein
MNTFKTLGVAVMLALSLLLSGVACVLIAMSIKQQPPISDAEIVVAGVGNSGNTFSSSSGRRVARLAAELNAAPQVSDQQLQQAVAALAHRATQEGDPDAAAFLFELASLQRGKAPQTAPAPTTGR